MHFQIYAVVDNLNGEKCNYTLLVLYKTLESQPVHNERGKYI
jgi:hypothetical protein